MARLDKENRKAAEGPRSRNRRRASRRIHLSPPHVGDRELEAVRATMEANWVAPAGPEVEAFENEFAQYLGGVSAAALNSGTAALHLALRLLGVSEGDHVLCSTLTFVASANPILYQGARPVFIDADRQTWNLDPKLLEEELRAAGRRGTLPRAAVVADIFGQSADYAALRPLCDRFGVALVEDAAESLGALYRGRPVGTFGDFGVFSFNGNKIITTGGGGMLVSPDEDQIQRARFLATQARDAFPHYEHSSLGYNYRLSSLLAAVGRVQLERLEERIRARRRVFEYYQRELADLPGLEFMPEAAYGRATRWLTCITIDPKAFGADREAVRHALEAADIEARPVWKPLHLQPLFVGCRVRGGGVAEGIFEKGLCLPSGSSLREADLDRVVEVIRDQCRNVS